LKYTQSFSRFWNNTFVESGEGISQCTTIGNDQLEQATELPTHFYCDSSIVQYALEAYKAHQTFNLGPKKTMIKVNNE